MPRAQIDPLMFGHVARRRPRVAVLDHGSGNVRSAVRMLDRVGADTELTADPRACLEADGLVVPGVGNFHACVAGMRAVGGDELVARRLDDGRPVLGICVGMQVMFASSSEPSPGPPQPGLGRWPGVVDRLDAPVVPHMGWSRVTPPPSTRLFAGVEDERFYFVHSYAATDRPGSPPAGAPGATWAEHGSPFVAAVEDGALAATQFHPEKSGDAGARLLRNWLDTL